MQDYQVKELTTKTIKFDQELLDEIEGLAEGSERVFSEQVRYMLKRYLQIQEK